VQNRFLIVLFALLATISLAQDTSEKAAADKAAARNDEAGESSSRDTRIDISPPKDDSKSHPASKAAVADFDAADNSDASGNPDTSGVQEFHPWSPLKALKDIEVGDYYFRQKNYKGALARYQDALYYKEGDAVAISRMAVCESKLGNKTEAKKYFEQYLKILPDGPFAKEARASLDKMAKVQ
jgi:tetratricopeptide (TPR) repeat protein